MNRATISKAVLDALEPCISEVPITREQIRGAIYVGVMVMYDLISRQREPVEDVPEPHSCPVCGVLMVEIVGEDRWYCPPCCAKSSFTDSLAKVANPPMLESALCEACGGHGKVGTRNPGEPMIYGPGQHCWRCQGTGRILRRNADPQSDPSPDVVERAAEAAFSVGSQISPTTPWSDQYENTKSWWRRVARAVLEAARPAQLRDLVGSPTEAEIARLRRIENAARAVMSWDGYGVDPAIELAEALRCPEREEEIK